MPWWSEAYLSELETRISNLVYPFNLITLATIKFPECISRMVPIGHVFMFTSTNKKAPRSD